ncbi:hypothetical protein FOZ63_029282 [Perkinsus olseni]|uniref:Uncharacterized protein n=1 Tax=Perkinsus olseni TaxID=32597 RepID=A0A7J6SXQ4_PEROL|nr:hypothetical protein FOZ63_029282 [Perkinsus olseni]
MSIYSYTRPRFILLGLASQRCTVGRQFIEWIRMHGDGSERGPEDFTSWSSTSPVLGDISESEIVILLRPWATDPLGLANSAVKALKYFSLKEKDIALVHGLPFLARGKYRVQHALYPQAPGEEIPATLANQKQPRVYAYDKVPHLMALSTLAKALGTTFYKRIEIGTKLVRSNREPPSEIFSEVAKEAFNRIHGSWRGSDLFETDCARSKVFARTLPSAKEFGYVGEGQPINTWRRTRDGTKDPKPVGLQQLEGVSGRRSRGTQEKENRDPKAGARRRTDSSRETEKAFEGEDRREEMLARVLRRERDKGSMDGGGRIRWSSSARPMGLVCLDFLPSVRGASPRAYTMYDRNAIAKILAETDKHLMEIGRGPPRSPGRELPSSLFGSFGAFSEAHRSFPRRSVTESPVPDSRPAKYDVSAAMSRQQEAIDALVHDLRGVKNAQAATSRDLLSELTVSTSALERKVLGELSSMRTEMESVRNDCRRQSIRVDGIADSAPTRRSVGDAEGRRGVTREEMSTVDRNLRVRLDSIEKALDAKLEGFQRAVEESILLRLADVEKRMGDISPKVDSSIEVVEGSLARVRGTVSSQEEAVGRLQREVEDRGRSEKEMLSLRDAVESLANGRVRREARIDALSSSLAALASQVGEQETKLGELVVETKRELTEVRRTATSVGPEFEKKLAAVLQRNVEKMRSTGTAGQGDKRVTLLEGKMAKVMDQLDLFDAIFERDGRKLDELWGNRGCEDVIALIEESLVQDRLKLAELWHRYTEEDGWEEGIERRVGRLEADERESIEKVRAVDEVAGVIEELRALRDDLRSVMGEVGELRGRAEAAERRLDEMMRSMKNFDRKTREVDGTSSVARTERSEAGSQKPDSDSSHPVVVDGTAEDTRTVSREREHPAQEVGKEADQSEPVDKGPEGAAEGSPSSASPGTPAVPRWSKGDELSGLSSDLDIPRAFNATDDVECSAGPDIGSSQAPILSDPVMGSHRGGDDDGVAESAGSDASYVKSKIIVELGTTEAAEEPAPVVQGSESGDEGRPWSLRAEVQLAPSHLVLAAQRELDVTVGSHSEVGSIPEDCPSPPPSDPDDDGPAAFTGAETRPTGVIAVDDIVKKNASHDDWDDDEEEFDY